MWKEGYIHRVHSISHSSFKVHPLSRVVSHINLMILWPKVPCQNEIFWKILTRAIRNLLCNERVNLHFQIFSWHLDWFLKILILFLCDIEPLWFVFSSRRSKIETRWIWSICPTPETNCQNWKTGTPLFEIHFEWSNFGRISPKIPKRHHFPSDRLWKTSKHGQFIMKLLQGNLQFNLDVFSTNIFSLVFYHMKSLVLDFFPQLFFPFCCGNYVVAPWPLWLHRFLQPSSFFSSL